MADINLEQLDAQNAKLSIRLSKTDYKEYIQKDIASVQGKLNMKGFRKGKVPPSLIKKMYGTKILTDNLNKVLNEKIESYLKEKEIKILGQPLPTNKLRTPEEFDINKANEFEFEYEMGLAPQFELGGLDDTLTIPNYKIDVEDATVQKEIEQLTKRYGEYVEGEEVIEDSMLTLKIQEIKDGVDVEGGINKDIFISMDTVKHDGLRADLIGKKLGEGLLFNIFDVEDKDEAHIRQYVLGITDPEATFNEQFEGRVENIRGLKKAELNQEFYDKLFGPGEVESEEAFQTKMKEELQKAYERRGEEQHVADIQTELIEHHGLKLPDEFLKKWMLETGDKMTKSQVDDQYSNFSRDLKWTLIREKIIEQRKLELKEEDLRASFETDVRNYFPEDPGQETINGAVDRLMSGQEYVERKYRQLMDERVFGLIKESVVVEEKTIGSEEFEQTIVKKER